MRRIPLSYLHFTALCSLSFPLPLLSINSLSHFATPFTDTASFKSTVCQFLLSASGIWHREFDMVSDSILKDIESMVQGIKRYVPIFFTKMDPTYLFEVGIVNTKIPLTALHEATILCVSAIGSAEPFVKRIQEMGALYVDRIDFSDHHIFHSRDIEMIRARLGELEGKFGSKPVVVITEKDYDRDPEILKQLFPFEVYVLCSTLKVLPYRGSTEDSFKKFLKDQLKLELPPPLCY